VWRREPCGEEVSDLGSISSIRRPLTAARSMFERGRRTNGGVVISTKSHAKTQEEIEKDLKTSLRELNRDTIDLYQLHLVNNGADLAARRGVVDYLLERKRRGVIRALGASVHRVEAARAVVADPRFDVLFRFSTIGVWHHGRVGQRYDRRLSSGKGKGDGCHGMKPSEVGISGSLPKRHSLFFDLCP